MCLHFFGIPQKSNFAKRVTPDLFKVVELLKRPDKLVEVSSAHTAVSTNVPCISVENEILFDELENLSH